MLRTSSAVRRRYRVSCGFGGLDAFLQPGAHFRQLRQADLVGLFPSVCCAHVIVTVGPNVGLLDPSPKDSPRRPPLRERNTSCPRPERSW